MRRQRPAAAVTLLLLGAAGIIMGPHPSGAAAGQFQGTAAGAGVRITMYLPNSPATSTPIDGGGPVAQAALDSLPTSQAYASTPYPGDTAIAGPGLLAGFIPGFPTLPGYPFYAASSHPQTPEAKVEAGSAYTLTAKSTPSSSVGAARAGSSGGDQPGGRALADAAVTSADDGIVVALSSGEADAFTAGPLRIGRIASRAKATLDAAGKLTRESALDVTGMSVAGIEIGVNASGLTLAGSDIPLPAGNPVQPILAEAGIDIAYVRSEQTEHGIISAGLKITQAFTFPTAGSGTLTYAFGQASASLAPAAPPAPEPVVDVPVVTDPPVDTAPPAPAPAGSPTGTDEPTNEPGAPLTVAPASPPEPVEAALAEPLVRSTPTAAPRPAPVVAELDPEELGTTRFYVMLVIAAGVALLAAQLTRVLAVRLPWNS